MAAVLSSDMDKTEKVVPLIEECRSMGLKIKNPTLNESDYQFTVNEHNEIVYGLGAIKGAGEAALQTLIAYRQKHGAVKSVEDFFLTADFTKLNKRVLEGLVNAGVFDDLEPNRRYLLDNLSGLLKLSEQTSKNQQSGQGDLFGMGGGSAVPVAMPTFAGKEIFFSPQEQLQNEKAALGLYLTGHPIDTFKEEILDILNGETLAQTLERIGEIGRGEGVGKTNKDGKFARRGKRVWVAGLVMDIRTRPLKSGNGKMAFVTIDDRSARTEVSFFSKAFEANQEVLKVDEILIIRGRASYDDFSGGMKISADYAFALSRATELFAEAIQLTLDATVDMEKVIHLLKDNRFESEKGGNAIDVYLHVKGCSTEGKIRLSPSERVVINAETYGRLLETLGKERVSLKYNLSRWQEPSKADAKF